MQGDPSPAPLARRFCHAHRRGTRENIPMKKLLLAAALVGLAACTNPSKDAVGSAEAANAPKAECTGSCSGGGECCTEKGACSEGACTKPEGAVCPVTGQASN
jgi:hypothetical protein